MNGTRYLFSQIKKYNACLNVSGARSIFSSFGKGYVGKSLDDGYKPSVVETERSKVWASDGRYTYKGNGKFSRSEDKVFSMILPPPNVTGNLHLGHALTTTLQDVLARWKRMTGHKVMFLPGTDHAGIATQVVVEKYLAKKGLKRQDLGKEKFVEEVWKWKELHGNAINEQLKRLGASLDWSREVFTMDEKHSNNVKQALFELNRQKIFHRHTRLINWSIALGSTISDMEIDTLTIDGPTSINVPGYTGPVEFGYLTYIAYPLDGSTGEIIVATTRPETILGDVAIAVNPMDSRYKGLAGRKVKHPLIPGKTLPIIEDSHVQTHFGSGVLKITPAHDRDDHIIALKHKLPIQSVINESGLMVGPFRYYKMPRYVARQEIIKDLHELGLLRDHVPHHLSLPICNRTGDVVEIMPRDQWFIECKTLNRDLKAASDKGALEIIPSNHKTVWNNWLNDDRDWCLSRQLWWGIDLPIWEISPHDKLEEAVFVQGIKRHEAINYAMTRYNIDVFDVTCKQDPDVMDTWFSSGTYPFTALGWPKETNDFKQLYPLSILVTGYDILCLWVMRMAMLGLRLTGKLPFSKVLLHGIITDARGAKMSKSKGNVINPIDVINGATLEGLNSKSQMLYEMGTLNEKELKIAINEHKKYYPKGIPECGADALRLTLCEVNPKNQMIVFNIDKCYTNKLFGNKIWQSVKYYKNCYNVAATHNTLNKCTRDDLHAVDIWLLGRLHDLVSTVDNALEKYDFHLAVAALKTFLYEEMCDKYIECTKQVLKSDLTDKSNAMKLAAHCHVFSVCFNTALRCLAPFMPFLTDELLQAMPSSKNIIHNFEDTVDDLEFPDKRNYVMWKDEKIKKQFNTCMTMISSIRKLRHTFNIEYKFKPQIFIKGDEMYMFEVLDKFKNFILFITKCESVDVNFYYVKSDTDLWSYNEEDDYNLYLKLPQNEECMEKLTAAKDKLTKKREKLEKNLEKLQKLNLQRKVAGLWDSDISKENLVKIKALQEDLKKIEHLEKCC